MRHGILGVPQCAVLCTKKCFSVSARRSMFRSYCAWGGEFLGLASLWSTNDGWLRSRQPVKPVIKFVVPSTLAEERLPHRASACLCLKCIPSFSQLHNVYTLQSSMHRSSVLTTYIPHSLVCYSVWHTCTFVASATPLTLHDLEILVFTLALLKFLICVTFKYLLEMFSSTWMCASNSGCNRLNNQKY